MNTEEENNHIYSTVFLTVSVCIRCASIVENWRICNTFIVKAMDFSLYRMCNRVDPPDNDLSYSEQ